MLKKLIISLSLYTCACSLRAQVWTKILDSVPGFFQVTTLVKDTVSNVLYLGGEINTANDKVSNGVFKYNGVSFDPLGSGIDDNQGYTLVKSLAIFQNKLYVCGTFHKTGPYWCNYVGRWNGTSWDSVNFNPNKPVGWSDVYNNELYVSGSFDTVAGQAIKHVAKFDGTNWHDLSFPYADRVEAIKNYKGTLYAASYTGVWQYKNNTWTHLADCGGDMFRAVFGMEVIDSLLYMYGRFNSLGGVTSKGIVAFDGVKWYGLGQGMSYSGYEVINNVQKIDGKIYITGNFENIEGIGCSTANQNTNYAVLDNNQWCIKSPPFDNAAFGVVKYNGDLHIYGAFTKCGTDTIFGFAKWNGGNSNIACSNTFSITNTYVGINEISITDNISIYPNPTPSIINIVDENNQLQNATIQIKNYLGQLVYASAFTSQINLSNLS
ncbi:MAG: T9SS type A sorting domain-containing protein, partial [Bacteroidia bacterium]|nr:T9SS type A sorting domain-containing protein [Bacteroidia bacterium]